MGQAYLLSELSNKALWILCLQYSKHYSHFAVLRDNCSFKLVWVVWAPLLVSPKCLCSQSSGFWSNI